MQEGEACQMFFGLQWGNFLLIKRRRKDHNQSPEPNDNVTAQLSQNINVKRTLALLEKWPGVVSGYKDLFSYTLFFLLFTLLVRWQMNVKASYDVHNMLTSVLLDQSGALAAISTEGQFFDYLLRSFDSGSNSFVQGTGPTGGILGNLFSTAWYNGDPITASDSGMLFDYNKLIGGVLIVQERSYTGKCPYSVYNNYYPVCYDGKPITAIPPTKPANGSSSTCSISQSRVIDTASSKYAQYLKDLESSKFGDRAVLESSRYAKTIKDSFEYRYNENGFSVFLSLAEGPTANLQKVQDLESMSWLDYQTRKLSIKFTFYNGNYGTFTYAKITFQFNQLGSFIRYDPGASFVQKGLPGATSVSIGTLNIEPYLTNDDFARLSFEVIFMVWVFYFVSGYLVNLIIAIRQGALSKFFNMWAFLDLVNYSCYITFICLRIDILRTIICNPVYVPTNQYNPIFETLTLKTRNQLAVNFVSILIGILRFFKYYQFQPRLQVINKTMSASIIHLYHFCFVFIAILFGYSLVGHINFGNQNRDFSTFFNAVQCMWESLWGAFDIGPTIGNYDLAYINPYTAQIFFISWMFVTGMVLMNVFVAILMDGYACAKEEGLISASKSGKDMPDAVHEDVLQALGYVARSLNPRSWKYDEGTLMCALRAIDARIPDPVMDKRLARRELEFLKDTRDGLSHRIHHLEELCEKEFDEFPFLSVWNQKICQVKDLVPLVPRIKTKIAADFNLDEAVATYKSRLVYNIEEGEDQGKAVHAEYLERLIAHLKEENRVLESKLLYGKSGKMDQSLM